MYYLLTLLFTSLAIVITLIIILLLEDEPSRYVTIRHKHLSGYIECSTDGTKTWFPAGANGECGK